MKQHLNISQDSGMLSHIALSKCNASHRWTQRQKPHDYDIRSQKIYFFLFFFYISLNKESTEDLHSGPGFSALGTEQKKKDPVHCQ